MGCFCCSDQNNTIVIKNVYGDVSLRKARRKRQKLLIQELFFDYANNTTLHGLPYITNRRLTAIEKIFWLITFIISVGLCGYYISSVWLKWKNSPVIVTVSERLVPVSEVLFPSVTICPQSKSNLKRYNIREEYEKLEEIRLTHENWTSADLDPSIKRDFEKFEDVALVCNQDYIIQFNFRDIHPRNSSNSSVIENILSVLTDDAWTTIRTCSLRGMFEDCRPMFKRILTSQGVCYNINSLPLHQIYREQSLPLIAEYLEIPDNKDAYEKKANATKLYQATEFSLSPDMKIHLAEDASEQDDWCNPEVTGYKVYVQRPDEVPQASVHSYAVLNEQKSSMALSFSIMNTSKSLERYDPHIRQCFLPHERYLQHFQIYTTNNCRIECLANITLSECGCVGFYMPRTKNTRICTWQDSCMYKAAGKLLDQESDSEKATCQCLPPCDSIEYEADILKTEYNFSKSWKIFATSLSLDDITNSHKHSELQIYFKKPRFISMRRSEMFGMIDFLANCGGLLGLFLGFSFLSLVEAVYFITLRLWCTLKKDLEEEKAQTKDDKENHKNKY